MKKHAVRSTAVLGYVLIAALLGSILLAGCSLSKREAAVPKPHQPKGPGLEFVDLQEIPLPEMEQVESRGCTVSGLNSKSETFIVCEERFLPLDGTQTFYLWSPGKGLQAISQLQHPDFVFVTAFGPSEDGAIVGDIDTRTGSSPFVLKDGKLSFPYGRDVGISFRSVSNDGSVIFATKEDSASDKPRHFLRRGGKEEELPLDGYEVNYVVVNNNGDCAGSLQPVRESISPAGDARASLSTVPPEHERGFVLPHGGTLFVNDGAAFSRFDSLSENGRAAGIGSSGADAPGTARSWLFYSDRGVKDLRAETGEPAGTEFYPKLVDSKGELLLLTNAMPSTCSYRLRKFRGEAETDLQAALARVRPGFELFSPLAINESLGAESLRIAGQMRNLEEEKAGLFVAKLR